MLYKSKDITKFNRPFTVPVWLKYQTFMDIFKSEHFTGRKGNAPTPWHPSNAD